MYTNKTLKEVILEGKIKEGDQIYLIGNIDKSCSLAEYWEHRWLTIHKIKYINGGKQIDITIGNKTTIYGTCCCDSIIDKKFIIHHIRNYKKENNTPPKTTDFKIGDIVTCIATSISSKRDEEEIANKIYKRPFEIGKDYEVMKVSYVGDSQFISIRGHGIFCKGTYADQFILKNNYNNKPNIMASILKTIKNIALKATDPDEVALREAELHDNNGDLTEDGVQVLLSILNKEKRDEMVKTAHAINIENKEQAKN